MDRKIRVGAVSYLNSKPLIFGLAKLKDRIEIIFDYPSRLATMLQNDEIDIGLVPVATIPDIPNYQIISDYCIGADKPVNSVCLFSEVPVQMVEKIYLDYQSRTSVALLKLLLKEYWNVSPQLIDGMEGFEDDITETTAALIIGDRALEHRNRHAFVYDLAEAWINHTGLPFVFAAWTANKQLDKNFLNEFNIATGEGMNHIPEIAVVLSYTVYDLEKYYSEDLDFDLDKRKMEGLNLFLQKLRMQNQAVLQSL